MSTFDLHAVNRPPSGFSSGLRTQVRVLGALMMRELSSRFGRENIGYLWMFGEPMMLASVITLVHVAQPTHYASDIGPAPFAIIGYTIFIIFRGIFNKTEGVLESSRDLFYHRMVSGFDLLLARAIVETIGCATTLILLMILAVSFGYASLPVRPLYLMGAVALMFWWSLALSLIAASLTHGSETLGRQLHVIAYFSIPISGAFWMMSWVPEGMKSVLEWFPMPLIFEQARYGQFRTASAEFVSPVYVIAWCAALTYIGLLLTRRDEGRVES